MATEQVKRSWFWLQQVQTLSCRVRSVSSRQHHEIIKAEIEEEGRVAADWVNHVHLPHCQEFLHGLNLLHDRYDRLELSAPFQLRKSQIRQSSCCVR